VIDTLLRTLFEQQFKVDEQILPKDAESFEVFEKKSFLYTKLLLGLFEIVFLRIDTFMALSSL
jgi:hypothetical protein